MPPLEQRNWCLPEGLFQANILVLEKYSQRCPTRNLKAEVDFSIIFFFFSCALRNPFVVLHADFPDNPLRKDIGIQGMETENVLGADLPQGPFLRGLPFCL